MKLITQIGIIFALCWVSQCIEHILPFPFPAGVIGLILLLVLLTVRAIKVGQVKTTADFLLGNLGFFFLPIITSLINYAEMIWEHVAAFITICVVSTVLTYLAAAGAVRLTCRLMEKRKGERT